MTKKLAQKVHAQRDVVSVEIGIVDCGTDFFFQFRSEGFVGVNEEYPVKLERQSLNGPLTFLGPASPVRELHQLGAKGASDFRCGIGALGIDDIDLANIAQRFKATRQVLLLIASSHYHADRQFLSGGDRVRLDDFFDLLHASKIYK